MTSQEKEEIGLASPRLGVNNSNTKPCFVTAFSKTTLTAKKRKTNKQTKNNKQRHFWFSDALTSSQFLVIGQRAPGGVSSARTSSLKKNIGL